MIPVEFSEPAELDLERIGDYIAADNPARALSFIAELRDACLQIGDAALATQARPYLCSGLRSRPFGNYVIYLTADSRRVLIVRILHGVQDSGAVFAESDPPGAA